MASIGNRTPDSIFYSRKRLPLSLGSKSNCSNCKETASTVLQDQFRIKNHYVWCFWKTLESVPCSVIRELSSELDSWEVGDWALLRVWGEEERVNRGPCWPHKFSLFSSVLIKFRQNCFYSKFPPCPYYWWWSASSSSFSQAEIIIRFILHFLHPELWHRDQTLPKLSPLCTCTLSLCSALNQPTYTHSWQSL